ncbi:MAG: FAD-dependent thymidylate synthase [Myxococcota bacterium]|jgi:flavin-dependent thymidylate synthase|nr:FAD-dependent thymidylate synthase [Myxococcota bacterium]
MRVVLAGFNVDSRVVAEAIQAGVPQERMSPEVLSAAYARISRDPKPVTELRREALDEVEKARTSNRKIIFGMGHHSVAEHAVFNFDILGASRLAIETIEHFRLCSFTEKSQRYITLDNDFVIPEELSGTALESRLISLVTRQAELYESLHEALRARIGQEQPDLESSKAGQRLLDSWAKEDARYVTILATTGQLGMTANARNLELMIRRTAASGLVELQVLAHQLFEAGAAVAPSVLLFTEPCAFDTETWPDIVETGRSLIGDQPPATPPSELVRVVHATSEADSHIAATMLATALCIPFDRARDAVRKNNEALPSLVQAALRRMEFYDSPPREFEHASLCFELVLSSCAFAQLKRHRMATLSVQDYDPSLGLTVPPSITAIGETERFEEHAQAAESLWQAVRDVAPRAAAYALTNAHRRRVLATMNLRDLYHFVRLREDKHAQWDIRDIASQMRALAEAYMPLCSVLLSGKDSYPDKYEAVFGKRPAALPSEV